MKKLITAIALLTASMASNAAIVSITENHKLIGDESPFRIMWEDFDKYGSIQVNSVFTGGDYNPVPLAFFGIDQNGFRTNVSLPSPFGIESFELVINELYANEYPHGPDRTFAGFFTPTDEMFSNYIGMELAALLPIETYQNYFPIDDEQAAFVSQPENLLYDCYEAKCSYTYNPSFVDENDIQVLGAINDYRITYEYNDTQEESANVPEPTTTALLGLALAGGLMARHKKKA